MICKVLPHLLNAFDRLESQIDTMRAFIDKTVAPVNSWMEESDNSTEETVPLHRGRRQAILAGLAIGYAGT